MMRNAAWAKTRSPGFGVSPPGEYLTCVGAAFDATERYGDRSWLDKQFKALWLDIEEILRWGTEIDADRTLYWVGEILGPEAGQYARLAGLLGAQGGGLPSYSSDQVN